MCRYAHHPVKTHYVCLPCRRSFKADPQVCDVIPGPRCPQCANPTIDAGRDFKTPKRSDDRAWRVLTAVLDSGLRFDSCGCNGPGYRPRTPAAVRARTRHALRNGRTIAAGLSDGYGVY